MMVKPLTDAFHAEESGLLQELICGNEKAFYRIFDEYHHRLYLYVKRFLKSPDLTDDAVQEIFIRVWEARALIKPEHSFKAFLFTVARNHVLNILKKAAREEALKKRITHSAVQYTNQCEDVVVLNDLNAFAEGVIDGLPPQRKLVFELFRTQGKDYREIAAVLGISSNTVRDHLAKASKYIRRKLKVAVCFMCFGVYVCMCLS